MIFYGWCRLKDIFWAIEFLQNYARLLLLFFKLLSYFLKYKNKNNVINMDFRVLFSELGKKEEASASSILSTKIFLVTNLRREKARGGVWFGEREERERWEEETLMGITRTHAWLCTNLGLLCSFMVSNALRVDHGLLPSEVPNFQFFNFIKIPDTLFIFSRWDFENIVFGDFLVSIGK